MRITLEPTTSQDGKPIDMQHARIVIDYDGEDHTLYDVIDYLVAPALKAWGYHFDRLDAVTNIEQILE